MSDDIFDNDLGVSVKYVPQKRLLPTGVSEFNKLIDDLKAAYDLPTKDDASIKFAVASVIMHTGPLEHTISLEDLYKTLVSAAAKQVAHSIFRETKLAQEAAQKAEAEKKQQEEASINGTE